ncbi:MAG: lysine-2,3-aminomutase-like protein [Gammaproteobacteria bacterium]|jgi:lysine 2,3-aminomutase|nr:lysine-2,3-aminomutase-like protein [Gammaproteobacteria bacterium]
MGAMKTRVPASLEPLKDRGLVDAAAAARLTAVAERYSVAITPAMLDLIDPDDPTDPIAAQFVPDGRELIDHPQDLSDPIGDAAHAPVPGIVHRYPDRVLLMPLRICPVYCRFCFRRETVGHTEEALLSPGELQAALDYIRAQPAIWEVILSGGDPLLLAPRRLGAILDALADIDHVQVVRIHTRVPAVDPARVTADLVAQLRRRQAIYVVLHTNHPRELTAAALAACARLVDSGIPMLSQSVLLRGVNDNAATLETLLRTLVANRIKPYYLHHADNAPGTAHFRTSIAAGQDLMRELRGRVSGLCQPEYILDIPGGHGKVPAGPVWVTPTPAGFAVTDPAGVIHTLTESRDSAG